MVSRERRSACLSERPNEGHHAAVTRRSPVAVVVPAYRAEVSGDERIAVTQLERYLASYPLHLVLPEGLVPPRELPEAIQERFPAACFESRESYSRLLLSRAFYHRFEAYEWILVYQLDSLVLRDELAQWCSTSYDYIGAPWLIDPDRPQLGFSRVGNGGLSLRRVRSFLDTLTPPGSAALRRALAAFLRGPLPDVAGLGWRSRFRKRVRTARLALRGGEGFARAYTLNEDRFWSDRAAFLNPRFRVAPVHVGLRFACEAAPEHSTRAAGGELPFGCHAWATWSRDFWVHQLDSASAAATSWRPATG